MLRSFSRVTSASSLPIRIARTPGPLATCFNVSQAQQQRAASAHAISNPTLANIEKRWEAMPPQEQADLWMKLRDRMKVDWHELTLQERKAAYWIAFGPHGPRAQDPPGEGLRVFWYTMAGVGISFVVFVLIRTQAGGAPKTMNKEYQEQMTDYLKEQKAEPFSGLSSKDYKGPGMVQSSLNKSQ